MGLSLPAVRNTGQAFALGLAAGVAPVPFVQGYIMHKDYERGHTGQPKAIPTALGTMVMSVAGLNLLAVGVRSNSAAIKLGAGIQGAAAGFGVAGAAAVFGYLAMDTHSPSTPKPAS